MVLWVLSAIFVGASGFHTGLTPRYAAFRSLQPARAAASALPIDDDVPTKVLYDGQCMVRARVPEQQHEMRAAVLRVPHAGDLGVSTQLLTAAPRHHFAG